MKDLDGLKNDPADYAISCTNAEVDNVEVSSESGGSMKALITSLVTSDAFLYRRVE